jgi:hypothetical protein
MADMIDTDIAKRVSGLLRGQSRAWSTVEHAEVDRFLDAGEYGLALDTLAWIVVEEAKPISSDDPFLDAVRNARLRQTA